ncbi:cytochrome P450 [Streptomyces sp. NPDC049040]|uniref:cytochrome P450 n=1 Tax=Streptomyces sp. NPDC049040 TaxID=3365593 RepID=UPI0037111294
MTSSVHEFRGYDEVAAALADPCLVPEPAGPGPAGGMAWLRATVARFSAGDAHARRSALVAADLARLDPEALRRAAAAGGGDDPRLVVARAVADGLGFADPAAVAPAVVAVTAAYFGAAADAATDAAVAHLLAAAEEAGAGAAPAAGAPEEQAEAAANRVGILIQACDATARLVEHAARAAAEHPGAATAPVTALLAETLRHDPPVRAMRRVAAAATRVAGADIAAGDLVVLDIAAANRDSRAFPVTAGGAGPDDFDPHRTGPAPLTFGAEPRRCPGTDHALALAAGLLSAHPTGTAPATRGTTDTRDPAPAATTDTRDPAPAATTDTRDPAPAAPTDTRDTTEARDTAPADAAEADDAPVTDDRDPAEAVAAMVAHVLQLAETWTAWDGRPLPSEDRVYTPHKAIRRVADHLIDHLAELEARLVGEQAQPDHWHASMTTTPADLAPFTPDDLDEARSRLTRLARMWSNRLDTLTPDQLDRSPGTGWTFRQLAFHLTGSVYYADAVGDLTPPDGPR